ncbi:TMV resistance protein N-like [Heracleum sosnowskyi]|uniref:ADP-ribosyl cyclase/cyclic ADP-ribose hydrolase n=1 Tax=Heracleum sosnowskyi TaxID=360622 RepID=A0AAD8J253_9APIA|nr:TMV resistance protein N-like [Heracleum sosnowskyi]
MANETSFCHVFLSFRGETRDKFACFLYEALKSQGFVAFMDKSDIRIGDEVDLTIKEGIKNSMSAMIIFSQNYAYSTWCLDELVLILKRKKNSRYFIIPIFYEVTIYSLGNYGLALEKHRARHSDKVQKWREALVEVGNILGDHVEGLQSTFIQNVVKLFREKLAAKFPECRLPIPKPLHLQTRDKVVVYTANVTHGRFANTLIRGLLINNRNVAIEERNC